MLIISRRKLLALFGSIAAFGLWTGTVAADSPSTMTTISVDATNLRGYWASNRNQGKTQEA